MKERGCLLRWEPKRGLGREDVFPGSCLGWTQPIPSVFPVPSQRQGSEQQTSGRPEGLRHHGQKLLSLIMGSHGGRGVITDIKSRYLNLNCGE